MFNPVRRKIHQKLIKVKRGCKNENRKCKLGVQSKNGGKVRHILGLNGGGGKRERERGVSKS